MAKAKGLTKEHVVGLWKFMAKKYNFEVVNKRDSGIMDAIGVFLDTMNIQDKDMFMDNCAVTISTMVKNRVYVPFEIGEADRVSLAGQVKTCAHEAQHVVQHSRDWMFNAKYLASDTARASYEADAYRANMELEWYLTGRLLSPAGLANNLKAYSIGAADRKIAEKHLLIASKMVKEGYIITGTSKSAIGYLRRCMPLMRGYHPIGVSKKRKGARKFKIAHMIG